ncbi:MAG: NfeD family protein [Brevinematia bacterium]
MPYYLWFAVGAILIALEIVVPGFVIFWFGAGAVITSILVIFKFIPKLEYQFLVFFLSSFSLMLVWFLWLKKFFVKPEDLIDPEIKNLKGVVKKKIKPGKPGKVELYDNYHGIKIWKAYSDEELEEGEEVKISGAEGISLFVKK